MQDPYAQAVSHEALLSEGMDEPLLVLDGPPAHPGVRTPTASWRWSPAAVSKSRLMACLALWDALVPAALLVVAGRFEGRLGDPVNGGAAEITDALAVLLAVLSPLGLAMAGAYHHRRRRGGSRLMFAMRLVVVGMAVSWIALIVSLAAGWPVDFAQMAALSLLLPAGWLVGRWACDRHPCTSQERVLLVGSGVMADRLVELTTRHRERRLRIVGRVEADPESGADGGPPILGHLRDLPALVEQQGIDRVIVAFTPGRDSAALDSLRACVAEGVQVDVVPRFFDLLGPSPRAHSIGGLALMEAPGRGLSPAQHALKRGVDIVGSLALLILLSPVVVVIAAALVATDGLPVLFRQDRVGQRGRRFSILKFRTMSHDPRVHEAARRGLPSADGVVADDDAEIGAVVREMKSKGQMRVTPVGRFLRKTSLDELPQLINVLKGDMSLVGPRPLMEFEAASLSPWQLARQDLRPGLTGLWQVLGRSNVGWEERMQLDYSYVAHWSFASDLRILARTLPAVVKRDGAL